MKKTKKNHYKFLAIITFLGLFLASCSSDDDGGNTSGPEILEFEYGEGSSHSDDPVAYKGSDIHIETEIFAEDVVESITVLIHSHEVTPADGEVEWDFEQVYTGSNYQAKNVHFHEHIDVPDNILAGEYHIEFIVVDQEGNSTEAEGHLEILDPITISDVSIDNTVLR
ncbi:DUF4625 domain-containing protein [Pseudotamlana agarivorans]|uniref:DUF4625 domain-containing protein n=1 Tax=Pseudotamlana agarivorans TaxID=481183 RepID=UPI001FE08405|nr:DUF4625 domain-containing protein [Tamlana agarivorans]